MYVCIELEIKNTYLLLLVLLYQYWLLTWLCIEIHRSQKKKIKKKQDMLRLSGQRFRIEERTNKKREGKTADPLFAPPSQSSSSL
jgi:hypothetical protein